MRWNNFSERVATMPENRILIVDDDIATVKLTQYMLDHLGYHNTSFASTGTDAIHQANYYKPSIVILDIKLDGDMDGIEAGQQIRKKFDVPIIYFTAYEEEELLQRAKITEPYGYIIKPFNERDLHIAIEIALHRHSQEKKIAELLDYAKNIIDCSLDMIIACDNDRRITEFNQAAETAFGYRREEVLGQHINLIYADHKHGLHVHKKTVENGRCIEEIVNKRKDGSEFTSQLAASILKDSQGNPVGVMGVSHDITLLRNAQDALHLEQLYFENLFQSSPESIVLVDNKGTIQRINSAFTELFGYPEKEAIGKNIDLLIGGDRFMEEARTFTAMVTEGSMINVESERIKKDGTVIPVSILGAPFEFKGGQVAVYGIYRDISEQKRTEQILRQSEKSYRELSKKLAVSNSMKELLLDIITHDLKNPAGVIKGTCDLMAEEYPDNEMLPIICDSSSELLKVVDTAASISQVVIGGEIEIEELDLIGLINESVGKWKKQLSEKGIDLKVDLPDACLIKANPILGAVFDNYIGNAVKYAADGGELHIYLEEKNSRVTVNFADRGAIKLNDALKEKIFERSIQLEGKNTGRGLGLAIAKRIAEAHNAEVGVKENQPRGNIFFIRFNNK